MRRARLAALPVLIATGAVLLVCGGFSSHIVWPWVVLIAAGLGAFARWGLSEKPTTGRSAENGLLAAIGTLALAQLYPPLQPLMYLVGAGYVLVLPLRGGVALVAALIALDFPLQHEWPIW